MEHIKAFQRAGFTLTVTSDHDDYSDGPDWLGKFTDTWEEGALNHHKKTRFGGRHQYKWFIPASSVEEQRKFLIGTGFSKGVAEETARKCIENDYQRADGFGHEWHFITIAVTASRCGINLGASTLSGIESDSGDEYIEEVIDDVAEQAITEADESLDELLNSVHPLQHLARAAE